jgi:hypothetical protein
MTLAFVMYWETIMSKELVLTVWLHDETSDHAISTIRNAMNDVLRHPDIYPLIDDVDDEGWSYWND